MNQNLVCFEPDQYVLDRIENTTFWIAELSDSSVVWGDDDNPDRPYHHSAWIRLKKYCEDSGLFIVKVQLKFRSHSEFIYDPEAEGYALRRAVLGAFGMAESRNFIWCGFLKNGAVFMKKYSCPELILEEEEGRPPSSLTDCLIYKSPQFLNNA